MASALATGNAFFTTTSHVYMHNLMPDDLTRNLLSECLVTKSRRAARAITSRYSRLLAPHGLRSTQAALLFALSLKPQTSVSALAEQLAIERSAMTRNLKILERAGLIASPVHGQGRAQAYRLTDLGRQKLEIILPLWHEAQAAAREELGHSEWGAVQKALSQLAELS